MSEDSLKNTPEDESRIRRAATDFFGLYAVELQFENTHWYLTCKGRRYLVLNTMNPKKRIGVHTVGMVIDFIEQTPLPAEPAVAGRRRIASRVLQEHLRSDRGVPLVSTVAVLDEPVLTVERYQKWYHLFLLTPTLGQKPTDAIKRIDVEELDFSILTNPTFGRNHSPYVDHVPNPVVVQRMCISYGWEIDDMALELMIGRWVLDPNPDVYAEHKEDAELLEQLDRMSLLSIGEKTMQRLLRRLQRIELYVPRCK